VSDCKSQMANLQSEVCDEIPRPARTRYSSGKVGPGFRHSPKVRTSGKASGRSRWVFASMATLPTPFAGYSKGPGLTELLRLYVCGLQPRPAIQLSSSRVIANDNEYSRGSQESRTPTRGFRLGVPIGRENPVANGETKKGSRIRLRPLGRESRRNCVNELTAHRD
jgi:hypothetical protein